jgi:hypothetical protein
MSILETLTEGIVNRDLAKEGQALLNKWGQTGLLEGLADGHQKSSMARLLENQAKELLREASTMSAGDVAGFSAVAFPIVRRVFAGLIANDLVSVQPMSLPSGLIFFLDFTFGGTISDTTGPRMGNAVDDSLYGGSAVAAGIASGVNLINETSKADLSGPRTTVGYAYASPSGSSLVTTAAIGSVAVRATAICDGSVSELAQRYIEFDPDILSVVDSSLGFIVLDVIATNFSNADFDNMGAWQDDPIATGVDVAGNPFLTALNANANIGAGHALATLGSIRRLTRHVPASDAATGVASVRFVITTQTPGTITNSTTANALGTIVAAGWHTFPLADAYAQGSEPVGGIGDFTYSLENNVSIPEIDIKVDSVAITAMTKKLKAKWTPELGQDLNAYHNLDAEVELTSILSEQIALEIDREILADLIDGATAAVYYWSRSPGLFVNRQTGAELGVGAAVPDFTGTVSEWYETLIETINGVSAQIHRKTVRGGANFVVCGPEVANLLEFTAGFRANVTADADKGEIGAVKVGSLSRKFDVIVDPYFPRNLVLVGRRGNSFLESGYVYAPYVPLQVTPTIFGPEDFVPRKGVMTRYAKRMVRPDMYGLVVIRGMLGESGQ